LVSGIAADQPEDPCSQLEAAAGRGVVEKLVELGDALAAEVELSAVGESHADTAVEHGLQQFVTHDTLADAEHPLAVAGWRAVGRDLDLADVADRFGHCRAGEEGQDGNEKQLPKSSMTGHRMPPSGQAADAPFFEYHGIH